MNGIDPNDAAECFELLKRLRRQQQALVKVAHLWRPCEDTLANAAGVVTEAASLAVSVGRAGIWTFDALRHSFECLDLYQALRERHSREIQLPVKDYPALLDALEREDVVHASDACTAMQTRALHESYLERHAVGAVLAVPIHANARLAGMLCLEHVGGQRVFHEDEINTAVQLASVVSTALAFSFQSDEHRKAEADLRDQVALWSIFFDQNRDGIVVLRTDGSVYRANDRFADMLGYTPAEVHRLHVWDWDHQFDRETILGMLQTVDFSGDNFETRHLRKDGAEIDVEITTNGAHFKGTKLIFCNCRDITERKRDHEKIRRLATTDTLTGISNRGEFSRLLTEEIDRAQRYDRPLVLVMYDLDHFKLINDTFGHDVGDQVLKSVVDVVNEQIRRVDVHGRWGGEEFLLFLPETDMAAALAIAKRLSQAIANHGFDHGEAVTSSFGVTTLVPGEDFDALVKRADEALYLAKSGGRNRVEAAAPPAS